MSVLHILHGTTPLDLSRTAVTCAGRTGCSPSRKQFYLVKVLIASGIMALWMVLAGFYVYFQLRERRARSASECDSEELAARIESYRHDASRQNSFLALGGASKATSGTKTSSRKSVDAEVPLGMAPTGAR